MRVFVDTNIFLDYYFDRVDSLKPIGEFAFNFFKESIECKYQIVICEQIIEELGRVTGFNREKIEGRILRSLKKAGKIEIAQIERKQILKAHSMIKNKNIPFNDCLFAIIASELNLPIVSRDKHFEELEFVDVILPEEL